ncbi:hypothetical protein TrVE_jg6091 [Triparma verrucosa]|uniref:RNA polymerase I-specific transcription initiation factor RRN3 n=1 Tax=Triparma verrucosa TaxID=1606542 RepID=A0A9W7BYJ4_9STRA|nr:hypothetical protein TrVE_jg6091 [Triparma verrucosa]
MELTPLKPSTPSLYTTLSIPRAHMSLMLNLISSNSTYVVAFLNCVCKMLAVVTEDEGRIKLLHETLKTAFEIVPKSTELIFPILQQNFPYKRSPTPTLLHYSLQLLSVLDYCPLLSPRILSLLLTRCIEIDVEIKISNDGNATVKENREDDVTIFEIDGITGEATREAEERRARPRAESIEADEYADKLDEMLLVLFKYLEKKSQPKELYNTLLKTFEENIMSTHKSKFTQFIFFYLAGSDAKIRASASQDGSEPDTSQPIYRAFASFLLNLSLSPSLPPIKRGSAVSYLASFLSRSNFVDAGTISETLHVLLSWTDEYFNNYRSPHSSPPSSPRSSPTRPGSPRVQDHTVFYNVCQSIFYLMCFRGPSILSSSPSTLSPPRWKKLCTHRFKPLKHCLESVRREFISISLTHSLLTPEDVITIENGLRSDNFSSNSSSRSRPASPIQTLATLEAARRKGGVGGLGKGSNPLDSFFPFDPFLLRRCYVYVEGFYRMWDGNLGVETMESDDDESIYSSASEFYEEREEEGMAVSYGNYVRYGEEEEEHIDVREEKVEKRQRADSCVSTGSW